MRASSEAMAELESLPTAQLPAASHSPTFGRMTRSRSITSITCSRTQSMFHVGGAVSMASRKACERRSGSGAIDADRVREARELLASAELRRDEIEFVRWRLVRSAQQEEVECAKVRTGREHAPATGRNLCTAPEIQTKMLNAADLRAHRRKEGAKVDRMLQTLHTRTHLVRS